MNLFRIKIADQTFEIHAGYKGTSAWCSDYVTDDEPTSTIKMVQQDIIKEKKHFSNAESKTNLSGSYLEYMALLRKLTEEMIDNRILLMHGAAIGLHDNAYIFTAPSGTGKTTHILKWLKSCPDAIVINGDKPFLKFCDNGSILVCGSPWAGKEYMQTNTMMPLKSIILMERAEENQIQKINFSEASPFILKQIYRPDDAEKMHTTIHLIQHLQQVIQIYRFQCNNYKNDCFDVAYHALVQE